MTFKNWRIALLAAGVAMVTLAAGFVSPGSAAVPCQDCDQCMQNCVCQSDGTCKGDPVPNGTACDDFNDCTTGETCQSGHCTGGTPKTNGAACTIPGLGKCVTGGQCFVLMGFAVCQPQSFVECPKCQLCDPNTGQCTMPMPCASMPCSTGQCDPSTGECIAGHEGEACDDGNVCTTDTHCHAGECTSGAVTTPQPTPTASPTPSVPPGTPPVGPCVGDCGDDGQVTVDEILTMVNIALGNAPLSQCEAGDANGDQQITVDEILTAVNFALSSCPLRPSPTRTGGAGTTPTPTNTAPVAATATGSPGGTPGGGPSVARRGAGTIQSSTRALMVLPNLLSALLGPVSGLPLTFNPTPGTGSAATQIINTPFTCPAGGGGQLACSQDIVIGFPPAFGPPTYTVALNNCQVTGTAGSTLTFNGTLTAVGQQGDMCGTVPSDLTVSTQTLTVQAQGSAGTTTVTFSNFSAVMSLSDTGTAGACKYNTVDLQPTGTIAVATAGPPATSTQITFNSGSTVSIVVDQYIGQCVPQIYNLEINGGVTLNTDGQSMSVIFDLYDLYDDASSGHDMVSISGTMESSCFGGAVDFSTVFSLSLNGGPCPTGGDVDVTANANSDRVSYTATGGVNIDLGDDNTIDETFTTCLDPALFVCPAS